MFRPYVFPRADGAPKVRRTPTLGNMIRWRARAASDAVYGLGEGPVWDEPRQRLLWVDINAGTVHSGQWDGSRVTPRNSWYVDRTVGAVAVGPGGELLVAGHHDLWAVPVGGSPVRVTAVLPDGVASRLNDGGCDPDGRFLVGSLALDGRTGGEILARVEPDGTVTVLDRDLTLSNGLAWTTDGLLYSIDTTPGTVWVRGYPDGPRRQAFQVEGNPDGMCLDAEGNLWIAIYGGGQVRRYTPSGELIGVVEVPAPNVTCPAFIGEDLLISTAGDHLYAATVGVTGAPVPTWSGEPSGSA
jgi:sugar lactone lactonase YvrE